MTLRKTEFIETGKRLVVARGGEERGRSAKAQPSAYGSWHAVSNPATTVNSAALYI